MRHRLRPRAPAAHPCPRCMLPAGGHCRWCGHDGADAAAVAELAEQRRQLTELRRDRAGRRAWLVGEGRAAFVSCPACRQRTKAGLCEHCHFDTTDKVAIAGLVAANTDRAGQRAERRRDANASPTGAFRRCWLRPAPIDGPCEWCGHDPSDASAGFLESLGWVTDAREAHPWLLFGLPVAGFAMGLAYHYGGGRSGEGNNLIIDEIHDPQAWVPRRMAPLVFVGTVLTHLFGGSAGREGTAIQMSGSLTDGFARAARLAKVDRRLLLIAAIAGGFGSVFGVPLAGCVFALEVQSVGRILYDAIVPAMTASLAGDLVVRSLGVTHIPVPVIGAVSLSPLLVSKVVVAGLVFGVTAVLFTELTHGIKHVFRTTVRWAPARPLIGGMLVIALTYAVGSRDYLGLSLPLITKSLAGGVGLIAMAFALKLLFTSVTLGAGFQGGEVTPLFVIGATLGATLGHLLGVPVPLLAGIGFVAMFAGATNTPLACTIMGIELFGAGPIVLLAVACIASYIVAGERGIYGSQRVDTPKASATTTIEEVVTLSTMSKRRRLWLPAPGPLRHPDDEAAG